MTKESSGAAYHPVYRLLAFLVPAAAVVAVAALLLIGRRGGTPTDPGTAAFPPPAEVGITFVSFAPIDSIIAGGVEAFRLGDWDEAARLLSRARFFMESGIREGSIAERSKRMDLFIGLAEFYRGYPDRGIENAGREVERDPLDEDARWYLASMLIATGRSAEARSHLETLAGMNGERAAEARSALEKL